MSVPRRLQRWLAALALALAVSGSSGDAHAEEILVFAAASLTEALGEIGGAYEQQHAGIRVVFNFASSSGLARQIQEGAPADVFFSADEAKMDFLEKEGHLSPGTRRSLLANSLVIVVHQNDGLTLSGAADLAAAKVGSIALAEPQSVPAGIYAKAYLQQQGLWSKVIDKVIPIENVRAALAAVESGNVDAGIVYTTDAAISTKVRVAYAIPVNDGPRIAYPVAVLKESRQVAAATQFVAFLESEAALAVFRRHGFRTNAPVSVQDLRQ